MSVLQGTAKRWDQVTGYVRTRTLEEVVEMVKHGLKSGRMAPKQNGITVAKKRQVLLLEPILSRLLSHIPGLDIVLLDPLPRQTCGLSATRRKASCSW